MRTAGRSYPAPVTRTDLPSVATSTEYAVPESAGGLSNRVVVGRSLSGRS